MSDLFGNHIVGFPTTWLIFSTRVFSAIHSMNSVAQLDCILSTKGADMLTDSFKHRGPTLDDDHFTTPVSSKRNHSVLSNTSPSENSTDQENDHNPRTSETLYPMFNKHISVFEVKKGN